MILKSKTKVLGEKIVSFPLCPLRFPHILPWYQSWSCALRSWRLTAWALVRQSNYRNAFHFPVFLINCNEQWSVFFVMATSIEDFFKNQRPSSVSARRFSILIMKTNEMHYFSDLFYKVLYVFRTNPLSIIRSISALYKRNRYLLC